MKRITLEEVENNTATYNEYILSETLEIIAVSWNVHRVDVARKLMDTYGGTLEMAIIDWFRNNHK